MKPDELRQITDSYIESKFADYILKLYSEMNISANEGNYGIQLNHDELETSRDITLIVSYLKHKGFDTNITVNGIYIYW